MKSGIYQIKNLINGKIYIGSAVNMRRRWVCHKSNLSKNRHHSIHLQRSWNKYGENVFLFEVLEEVRDKNLLTRREQFWLDETKCYDQKNGYNISPTAGNCLGIKHTEETNRKNSEVRKGKKNHFYGKKHTEETKRMISEANKGRFSGDKNPMFGSKLSVGEKNPAAILNEWQVLEIRKKYKPRQYTAKMLSKEYGVSVVAIRRAISKITWKHI